MIPGMQQDAYLRIGELSRRTGVPPELLRAWERRYALLDPHRTPGGFRLYSAKDVRRVEAMREHLARGVSAAQAAALAVRGAAPAGERGPADGEDRKSTRLNSSHPSISYAVFCLKKKKK